MSTLTKTMTTQEVADRFNELAQEGKFEQIVNELFDQNAKSVEPAGSDWKPVQGIDQIRKKSIEWNSQVEEMHGGYTEKPQVAGKYFVCTMGMDVTVKGKGRSSMDEVALYEVKDGKIVMEQFFF